MSERAVLQDQEWIALGAPHVARYLAAAEYAAGRRVLDAASGSGYGAFLLKSAGANDVLGVDIDADSVRRATAEFGAPCIRFVEDDCQKLTNVSGPFDLICNFEAIEHFREPQEFLQRACRLLAPGGALLVSTPDRADSLPFVGGRPHNPFHLHEWYRGEFQEMLAEHFACVDFRVQVRVHAVEGRKKAVKALRQGLMLCNPVTTLIWRAWPWTQKVNRPWERLAWLAAPSLADYPIVPLSLAPLYGVPAYHFAICRDPRH
jgi:SAM-dependent methyltransferase